MSERQARVMELYHSNFTYREIAQILKRERPKDKAWNISHQTVANDIQHVIAYYQQQAVDFYADWLAKELSLTMHGHRIACEAFEASKRLPEPVKGKKKSKAQGEPPDARFSREMREWQNARLKLLGFVRETSKPAPAAPVTDEQPNEPQSSPADDLAPYLDSVRQWKLSIDSQGAANLPPAGAP